MIDDAVARIAGMRDKPWLVLGEGRSLGQRGHFDLDKYHTFSLNYACRVCAPTVAHFTDLWALWNCSDEFLGTDSAICMAYVPDNWLPWAEIDDVGPGHYNLSELVDLRDHVLMSAAERDKLWSYNSTRVPKKRYHKHLTTLSMRFFSAVAAFNILVFAGQRKIYTLGVDAPPVAAPDTPFEEIKKTCKRHGVLHINLAEEVKA